MAANEGGNAAVLNDDTNMEDGYAEDYDEDNDAEQEAETDVSGRWKRLYDKVRARCSVACIGMAL